MKKILFSILFLFFVQSEANSKSILIKPKQLLDVRSGKMINADILIESGVIKEVSRNIPVMIEYEIIELPDTTILPGLMDAHVHLTGNTDLKGHEGISESSYLATIYGVKNAKQTLLSGFTTVRNVGASNYSDVALRDGIERKIETELRTRFFSWLNTKLLFLKCITPIIIDAFRKILFQQSP